MKHNVGRYDRLARAVMGLGLVTTGAIAPLPFAAQVGLGAMGTYLVLAALAGRCVGYSLLGLSTCPLTPSR